MYVPLPEATKLWQNPFVGHALSTTRKSGLKQALLTLEYDMPYIAILYPLVRFVRLG